MKLKQDCELLTNGEHQFLWNVTFGSPEKMDIFPTQQELISWRNWNPPADKIEQFEELDYIINQARCFN